MSLKHVLVGFGLSCLTVGAFAACNVAVSPGVVDLGSQVADTLVDVHDDAAGGYQELTRQAVVVLTGSCSPALAAGVPVRLAFTLPSAPPLATRGQRASRLAATSWLSVYDATADGVIARLAIADRTKQDAVSVNLRESKVVELRSPKGIMAFQVKLKARMLVPEGFQPTLATRMESDLSVAVLN